MRGSRFSLSWPAPAYLFPAASARALLVAGQPMIGNAVAGVAATGHEPSIYHDVSVAMGEDSVTTSTSSLPSPAKASAAAASA